MSTIHLPDITPAQILAVVTFLVGQLVAYGVIDGTVQQATLSAAATLIPVAWVWVDALIRGKRNEVRAAAITSGQHDPAMHK